ncbi:hypothetical protein Tco_1513229, partial [Tanacetum coccineum]
MRGTIAQTRFKRVPTPPCDSPLLRVHTLGSDEGSMTLQELTVKKLEKTVKISHSRRRAKIVISDDAEDSEDSFKQGRMIEEIDQDAGVTLVTPTQGEYQPEDQLRRRAISTGSGGISTASASMPISTVGMVQEVNISIPSLVVIKNKGKGKMEESEDEQTKRTKLQQEQERLGHEATVRLQEELDEEERQGMTRVHIRKKYFAAQKAKVKRNKPKTQAQRNYMINYINHMGSHTLQQLKIYSFDELKELFETTMKNVNTFVPMETEDKGKASEIATGSSQTTIIDFLEVRSSKRAAEAELDHEGSKRQKTNEASGSIQEQPKEEEKELSQED